MECLKEDEWTCYVYGEIDETGLYVMRRHRDLGDIYGHSEDVVKSSGSYVERHLNVIAEHLGGQNHILDYGFSFPDILLVSCLDWAKFYGLSVPDVLIEYRNRIAERPAYQKAMQINYAELMGEINGTAVGN